MTIFVLSENDIGIGSYIKNSGLALAISDGIYLDRASSDVQALRCRLASLNKFFDVTLKSARQYLYRKNVA